ncbi:MAG: S1-like domain-containing RNA-binding protein [Verrucomicrobiota bacterium]
MANIGERASLRIIREKSFGLYLDGGDLGEVLLPHREVPSDNVIGGSLDVFIYTDSEDRPVATCKTPMAIPGEFARLKCVAVTGVGAFLDWGLPKELLVPFGEQKERMEIGKTYLVHILLDKISGRIMASGRLTRHLDKTPPTFKSGDEVDLVIFAKTDLGYKAVINNTHTGLLYSEGVFQPLQPGERVKGYISTLREDGKIDLTLHAPGRARVTDLEERILSEIRARGGFWALGDHSPAAEIHDELGVSKRTFKQAVGSLLKQQEILIEPRGLRLAKPE